MNLKNLVGLAFAAFLTGCGGANDHPEELLGTWTTACAHTNVQTYTQSYTFDEALTFTQENLYSDCSQKYTTMQLKLLATYEPELQTTSSGVEALRANVIAEDITYTPHDEKALANLQNSCPNLSWSIGQPTSMMTCQSTFYQYLVDAYTSGLKMLLFVDGDFLYLESSQDDFPLDVDYDKPYIKQ
ncbi:MAG: hypothetical protein JKY50_17585 [Oleispira sp.]|nr:hypothetical protein [Oleispira sp.]MBL4882814.1 hypothetical protein [Oleispira sp.]